MSNVIDLTKAIEDKKLLTIYHDCHRCNTARVIPQHIDKERDVLEKNCPKCGQVVAIW